MSSDRHGGPRVMLFLEDEAGTAHADPIREALRDGLPREFLGLPTNVTDPDLANNGVQVMERVMHGPVNHRLTTMTIRRFFQECLNIEDPEVQRIAARPLIGSCHQFSDSTDLLFNPSWRLMLRKLYD